MGKDDPGGGETSSVEAIDISPNSTRFATARYDEYEMFIWSIITRERLVGPLQHDEAVRGVRISPE